MVYNEGMVAKSRPNSCCTPSSVAGAQMLESSFSVPLILQDVGTTYKIDKCAPCIKDQWGVIGKKR